MCKGIIYNTPALMPLFGGMLQKGIILTHLLGSSVIAEEAEKGKRMDEQVSFFDCPPGQ